MNSTQAWARALSYSKNAIDQTLPGLIDALAVTHGDSPAMSNSVYTVSYIGFARQVNRYANWGLLQGLGKGDVICLMMANDIDYVAIWLGLTRIGCTVALLNTNLKAEAIAHCIQVAKSDRLIIDDERYPIVAKVRLVWSLSNVQKMAASECSADPLIDVAMPHPRDRALLIYTSGTTGLPKATNITHRRIVEWSFWFAGMMDVKPHDRLYNCLPMYHSVGGIVAVGSMLVNGGSVVIRERFSANRFWDDVTSSRCTIFQYIGELCRYLTLIGPNPREREHRLRLACGNGLQGDVWTTFQERFAIPEVLEFYAATEGNLSLYNCEGKPGAIGRIPPFLSRHFPVAIVQCDSETGVLVRNPEGFCVRSAIDQPGEAISQIGERGFDGYTDPEASQRKIAHDVFHKGDRWFRSGDLMRKDAGGYFYFIDRLGDTFRWKGENVSTSEVATVIRGCPGVIDAVVYGVPVPGSEGRAGMAAISTDQAFSFDALSAHLKKHLPDYARPVFVRLCDTLDTTGTFKLTKTHLAREGTTITDTVWQKDHVTGDFIVKG